MAESKQPNQGQQKPHQVRNRTTGETKTMTQEEWRNRDKAAGWERVDETTGQPIPEDPNAPTGEAGSGT